MGILGTSKAEEEALRAAMLQNNMNSLGSSASLSASAASAYDTASEFRSEFSDDHLAHGAHDNTNQYHADEDAEDASTIQGVTPAVYVFKNPIQDLDLEKTGDAHAGSDNNKPEVVGAMPAMNQSSKETHPSYEAFSAPNQHEPPAQRAVGQEEEQLKHDASAETERSQLSSLEGSFQEGEKTIKVSELDYDGPDDKENPHNWPALKKWVVTFTIANMCLCISLGSSLYVEGVPELMKEFGMSQTLALAGLSLYLLGLACGPVIGAPVSEMIGRRWIYITTFPAAILFTMGVGLSQNSWSVLILRFFTGFIASPPMSIAGGSIADIWGNAPEQMSTAMALFCLSPFLGPVIGPIIGGFAAEHKGWKWTMWVSIMFYGAMLPFVLWAPETFKPAILKKRAEKRGYRVIVEKPSFKHIIQVHLVRPLEMLLVEPIVGFSSLYTGFVFAVLFGFFEAFPIIFRSEYRMDTGVSGLPFIAVGVGLCLAVLLYLVLDKVKYFPKNPDGTRGKRDENGKLIIDAPESRLLIVKIGAALLPASLFWLAWTSRKSIHWIVPTLSGLPFGLGLLWIFFGIILYYSFSFPPQYVASAIAANNFLRYVIAGAFPLFTVQMYERLHIDWATSLFAFIALAMVPIPFAFAIWGPKLRLTSKYGYIAMFRKMAEMKAAAAAAQGNQQTEAPTTTTASNNNMDKSELSTKNVQDVAQKV